VSSKILPAPDLATSVAAVFRLNLKRLLRGRKLRFGVVALVLVVAATLIARYVVDPEDPQELVRDAIRRGFFGLLVYLLPFLFNSGAIAEEVETRTLPYLLLRPTGRLGLTLGKYLSGSLLAFVLLAAGVLVLHAGAYATEPSAMIEGIDETLRMIGALALLTLCYSAICLFWGSLITEASGLMSTLHLGALEFAMGLMPFALRFVSMNYWATQIAGLPKGGFLEDTVPDVELWIAVTVVTAVTFLFLGAAALVVRNSQFGFGKA
jgi:ABC-type transport system involved in multi-copper enzyme maturation permease subunit